MLPRDPLIKTRWISGVLDVIPENGTGCDRIGQIALNPFEVNARAIIGSDPKKKFRRVSAYV